jgi:saccharopine dehydrogenase-like NADP-dependent oxidoreductase
MHFLVLGSGLQGRACVYDLLRSDASHRVRFVDRDHEALESARGFHLACRTSVA